MAAVAPPASFMDKQTLSKARVLVTGDAMLDRYWFGDAERISPEAPVPVVRISRTEERLGGAANVAVNIASVDRQVASVLVDMTSSWTISYSLGLGASVLNEMKSVNRLHKKHVEQAGFAVLKGQGIPSILVETAFISNPTEEKLLINGRHQQKIAQAIYDGIRKQVAANPSLLTG